MEIDYDALERIALDQCTTFWFTEEFSQLSKVYVPGEGDNPKVFVVGEAPGATEEIKRRPFVGRAGAVLRQLMDIASLYAHHGAGTDDVPNCWLTNVVKFRPPRNRTPTWTELKAARPFLRAEWQAVGCPRVIVPVGGSALRAITGRKHISIIRHSGWMHEEVSRVDGKPLYVWPMLHPSYGLREPAMRSIVEKDWTNFGRWLDETYPGLIGG